MKKIVIILSIFVLVLSTCFADSITNNFPKEFKFVFSFDSSFLKKDFIIGNEFTKFISTVKSCLKDKYTLDFDNDVRRITFFTQNDKTFCYVTGKNNIKQVFSFSDLALKSIDNKFGETPKELSSLIDKDKNFIFINGKHILEFSGDVVATVTGRSSMKKMFTNIPEEAKKNNEAFRLLDGIKSLMCFYEDDSIQVEIKCDDSELSEQLMNYLETFRTLYSNNLQKDIDAYREKVKNSDFADFAIISTALYSHSKAKRLIDSIEINLGEDENIVCLKTKFDIAYIVRSVASIVLSKELGSDKFVKFVEAKEKANKSVCFSGQRNLLKMIKSIYNFYNKETPMTTLDEKKLLDFIEKNNYHPLEMPYYKKAKEIPDCEYYSEGDLTKDGYIVCKIHGSEKKPSTKAKSSVSSSSVSNSSSSNISNNTVTSNTSSKSSSSTSTSTLSQKQKHPESFDTRKYEPVKLPPIKNHPKAFVPEEVDLEPELDTINKTSESTNKPSITNNSQSMKSLYDYAKQLEKIGNKEAAAAVYELIIKSGGAEVIQKAHEDIPIIEAVDELKQIEKVFAHQKGSDGK